MTGRPDHHDLGVDHPPQTPPARSGVVGAMMVAVLLGAIIGAGIAAVFLPNLMAAAALGGALTAGALRVFVFLSPDRRGLTPIDDEDARLQ